MLDTEDDKCMFYYATAQRTHVYAQLLVCGLVLILYGFFSSHRLLHYSTFIYHPFISPLVCPTLPLSSVPLSSVYIPTTSSSSVLTLARYFIWHTPHSSVVSLKVLQGFPGTILSRRGATLHPPSLNLSIIFRKVQLKHVVHRLKCKRGGFCIGHCSAARHLLPHRTELQGYGPHHPDT